MVYTLSAHSVMPQLSWTHWYGLVAVKGFIIPAFLPAPAINFPCMDIVLSDTLLSPISALPRHCKYIHSAGAERACPRVTLNPRVGGLIPIIFLCTLLLWHCHSIVLHHCGQGCLLWPFFFIICYSLEEWRLRNIWIHISHLFTFS